MTPEDAASAIARPIGSIGSKFMFDPTTYTGASAHGYAGLDFYLAGRCGVLGDVDASVVEAALGFFEADNVARLWDQGRAVAGAGAAANRFAASCAQWGRDHFGPGVDYDELADLAERVADASPVAGLPLFAGWRALPVPDDGAGAAAQRLNTLRELRGGAHLVAVLAAGIAPLDAVLAAGGVPNAELFGFTGPFPDVTEVAALMAGVEVTTNRLAACGLEALSDEERDRFVALVRATRGGLI